MKTTVFTLTWQEEFILPHFLAHYHWADRIVIFDNESTDRTREIALADPRVTFTTFYTGGKYDEAAQTGLRNRMWREADADWVVVVDADEFVDLTPLSSVEPCEVAFRCKGRNMVATDGTTPNDAHRYIPPNARIPGVEMRYDKISVFSPKIADINYDPGMHSPKPTCTVIDTPRLMLRHYCWLGEEYVLNRFRSRRSRMSNDSLRRNYGTQYLMTDNDIRKAYRRCLDLSIQE